MFALMVQSPALAGAAAAVGAVTEAGAQAGVEAGTVTEVGLGLRLERGQRQRLELKLGPELRLGL